MVGRRFRTAVPAAALLALVVGLGACSDATGPDELRANDRVEVPQFTEEETCQTQFAGPTVLYGTSTVVLLASASCLYEGNRDTIVSNWEANGFNCTTGSESNMTANGVWYTSSYWADCWAPYV